MRMLVPSFLRPAIAAGLCLIGGLSLAASAEWNPIRTHGVAIGPQASRLVVGFKATSENAVSQSIKLRARVEVVRVTQAQTSAADVEDLRHRTGIAMAGSRQITPSMHVLFLQNTLYGADVGAVLAQLRADPTVAFADVDERRYPHAITPDDPLFVATGGATGQWYMQTPTAGGDAAATDAVSAWGITEGSSGTVIADVDSGILFNHPDLLRAGFGGRLLPGYDFVSEDLDRTNSNPLGSFLIANDGDGYDPDPSDPGDWVSTADMTNSPVVFPPADCGDPNSTPVDGPSNSSWHGTRVMGVLGAITNNGIGIAGMTWNPYLLPVRALGKCGGFDSDIIAGIQWSAGMTVIDPATGNPVPSNPYPADIINLSLGGSGSCLSDYQNLLAQLEGMGVLVVASAGNESGPVDAPGNCAGVLAVAGLRNVGTKVGYSSFGPQVGIGAPAGNCVNLSGACLRSIDTTSNDGLTVPGNNTYTNQTNVNLGTSFSAPIVSGVAALMRAVNGNLTPAQLIARIEASATPYPPPGTTPVCSSSVSSTSECACTTTTCGAGMVNAFSAVKAALNPIAAVRIPSNLAPGTATYDASGSMAACNQTIQSYAWSATGGVTVPAGSTGPQVMAKWTGPGTLVLTVTDMAGHSDTDTVTFTASGATTSGPSSAGTSANACPTPMTVTPAAPTIEAAFAPATVAPNATAVLTITLKNSNPFVLTQSAITESLPANISLLTAPAPATTCSGASKMLSSGAGSVTLTNANIPASGSCQITMSVQSATAATYTNTLAVNALMTGPAGGNAVASTATLDVAASSGGGNGSGSSGKSGGGALDIWDLMLVGGVLLAGRRRIRPRP
jgi:serine protease